MKPLKKKPQQGNERSDSVSRDEFFAEFGTVLEDINNKLLLVAESVVSTRSELGAKIDGLRSELKQDIADVRVEMGDLRSELKQDIADVRFELKQEISNFRHDVERSFIAVGESFESLHEEIQDIKRELAFVKERLTQKSDIDYVFSLEMRIRKLEVAMRKREKVRA